MIVEGQEIRGREDYAPCCEAMEHTYHQRSSIGTESCMEHAKDSMQQVFGLLLQDMVCKAHISGPAT